MLKKLLAGLSLVVKATEYNSITPSIDCCLAQSQWPITSYEIQEPRMKNKKNILLYVKGQLDKNVS